VIWSHAPSRRLPGGDTALFHEPADLARALSVVDTMLIVGTMEWHWVERVQLGHGILGGTARGTGGLTK
jgi:hypothetical protein